MNEALYDLLTESFTFGFLVLWILCILAGAWAWAKKELHLLRYNKSTKRFERFEAEEAERFGRNVKTFSQSHS